MNNDEYDQNLVNQFLKYDYHDRGMMKWQGFYLSDHTSVMNKTAKENELQRNEQHTEAMADSAIADVINDAIVKCYPVQVDKAERTIDGIIPHKIEGLITGWFGSQIIVNDQPVLIEDIYSIQKLA